MTAWPESMKVGPIREWPGRLTPVAERKRSPFTKGTGTWQRVDVPLSNTLAVLDLELRMLGARDPEMLMAIAPSDFRLDGRPRANARAEHPGVVLSFESKHGHLSYPCDTFTSWQANLRAIALALEARRKVDRYGVTKRGEQYRGFLELEATAAPSAFTSTDEALAFLGKFTGLGLAEMRIIDGAAVRALRRAQRETHPDYGGDPIDFQRVQLAELQLRKAGVL